MSCFQIQAKVVAVIEIIFSTLLILLFTFVGLTITVKRDAVIAAMNKYPESDDSPHLRKLLEASTLEQISLFFIPFCYFIAEFVLGILLYHSASKLNHKRLRCWFLITGTLLTVGVLFFIAEVLRHENFVDVVVIFVVNTSFTLYSMWVVYVLIGEIKAGGIRHPVPHHNGFHKL